jgi:leucyl aminopeptidase
VPSSSSHWPGDCRRRAARRDLADLPPNICTPAYLAETAEKMAAEHDGLSVEILDEDKEMEELGMNALLAVAVGSANPHD